MLGFSIQAINFPNLAGRFLRQPEALEKAGRFMALRRTGLNFAAAKYES
jgi:hypothetical protein